MIKHAAWCMINWQYLRENKSFKFDNHKNVVSIWMAAFKEQSLYIKNVNMIMQIINKW